MSLMHIPTELLAEICRNLSPRDRLQMQLVNTNCRDIILKYCSDAVEIGSQNSDLLDALYHFFANNPARAALVTSVQIDLTGANHLDANGQECTVDIGNETQALQMLCAPVCSVPLTLLANDARQAVETCFKAFRENYFLEGDIRARIASFILHVPNLESLRLCCALDRGSGGSTLMRLLHLKSYADQARGLVPFASLKTLFLLSDVDTVVPIFRSLEDLTFVSDAGELDLEFDHVPPGEPTNLRRLTIEGPICTYASVSCLVHLGKLHHLELLRLSNGQWSSSLSYELLFLLQRLPAECPRLTTLALDVIWQDTTDLPYIRAVPPSLMSNVLVKQLRIHVDHLLGRMPHPTDIVHDMPSLFSTLYSVLSMSAEVVEVSGLCETDVCALLEDKAACAAIRGRRPPLRSLRLVVDYEAPATPTILPHVAASLQRLVAIANPLNVKLGLYIRDIASDEPEDQYYLGVRTEPISRRV